MTYIDYFGLSSDINENQSCACSYCVQETGFCHCMDVDLLLNPNDCFCGGIPCNHKGAGGIVKVGSNITSALGGISHGVVDFVIGSLQDLQTAAVYMGSADLEMSLYERTAMIEAVEQSQMQQLAAMGSHFMEMLSIDASDAFYQSFRSKTTLGLEVGSLVAGGYGAVKGVIAFNRLARAPMQAAKLANQARNPSLQKIDNVVRVIEGFLEGKGKVIINADGDMILMQGAKKIRFDIKNPHGDKPHFHLEKRTSKGKWVDASPEHRYYFTEE